KTVASYNTGEMEGGHALSLLFSRVEGDGYVNGTMFEGYNYFMGYGWASEDDKHNVQVIVTGAPQVHNQRTNSFYNMADAADYEKYGIRYNYNHGYLNGQEFNWRRNFYHKPIASVNWEYKINESTNLSASAYYSVGRGGGTGDIGRLGGNYASSSRFRNEMTGEVEWDQIVNSNSGQGGNWSGGYSYNNNIDAATGLYIVNDQDERVDGVKRNGFVRRASVNSHNFVGSLINLKKELSEKLTLDFGVDLRNYRGIHYRRLDHLLGADGYRDFDNVNYSGGSAVRTTTYGSNVSDLWNVFKDTDNEEKIDYHNDGFVRWSGVFGQLEYSNDDLSVFVQGAMSNQGFQREEFFNQTPGNQKTDWKNISGGNIKGGANYNINAKSNVYVNAGTYSKQPNFDAVYINYGNNLNPDLRNEKVVGLEAGYGYRSSNFNFNVNIYKTSWKDRFLRDGVRVDGVNGNANYYGIEQVHTGIEFDGVYEISPFVKVEGMLTLGNYEYGGDVTADVFDSSNTFLGSSVIYLDGVKVGDAAQTTSRVNLIVTPSDLFKFNISMFNASDLYADFNVEDFTSPEDEAMMLPSYDLFDFGASYKLDIAGETVYLRANINNIFDNYYFAESATNYEAGPGDNTYLGVNTRNKVFPGWGRTWNVGFTYRF
ncbi:TonB-dependent receptor, partial [Flavobacteriaceae bacterium]|nr:TonB-dependent receptor [Flavobacteriaceae bacterium]